MPSAASSATQPRRLVRVVGPLAAVGHHVRQVGTRGQPDQPGEVVARRDVRGAHLVHRQHPGRGEPAQRRLLVAVADGGVEVVAGRVAHQGVGLALDPAGVVPAVVVGEAQRGRQRARHHRRVDVDPRQVDDAAVRGAVELGAGGRPALGPGGLVPAVAEDGPAPRRAARRLHQGQRLTEAARAGELHAGEGDAGVGGVRVRVDEGRCHQGALEVDDLVDPGDLRVGGLLGAQPADRPAVDDHRRRERVGGRVDAAAAVQDGAVAAHAHSLPGASSPVRAGRGRRSPLPYR